MGRTEEDLAVTVIKAVLDRTGIDPELIDDVALAQSYATMGIGPVLAVDKLFSRTGLGFSAIDLRRRGADARYRGCASCGAARAGTCWRPCASAAARAWPRSSRRPDPPLLKEHQHGRAEHRGDHRRRPDTIG